MEELLTIVFWLLEVFVDVADLAVLADYWRFTFCVGTFGVLAWLSYWLDAAIFIPIFLGMFGICAGIYWEWRARKAPYK